ncbi:MAG: hypothetical protein IPI49_06570 [Myxococcales bacterium]|nr:hypothetical protein [Myxococcales bacterium]
MRVLALALSFVSTTACSAAYADQPSPRHQVAIAAPRTALALAPERVRAPYDVSLVAEDGSVLSTYAHNGRYYVMGDAGERYVIRVSNPTPNRIEAVVAVDGLDVIDGESGDLGKRGYIVPPYGDLRIEGFRTSQSDVATFRFSSVGGSYAGKKGKARNVGVIAVALFEEQAAPEIVEEEIAYGRREQRRDYDYRDDLAPSRKAGGPSDSSGASSGANRRAKMPASPVEDRAAEAEAPASVGGAVASRPAPRPMPPAPPPPPGKWDRCCDPQPPVQQQRERLGLGTEFGEQRYSAASYTRFVRAAGKPIAIAELRYNDRSGLGALGIAVAPAPDEEEIMLRETADPFPGDRFARPPGR